MNFAQLMELARSRPVAVEFLEECENWEDYPERGMRAHVTGGQVEERDVAKMQLDFRAFDDHNKTFETANWHGPNNTLVTAREKGAYKPLNFVYVDPTQDIGEHVRVLDDAATALFNEYGATPEPRPSYVAWLEQQLVAARAK